MLNYLQLFVGNVPNGIYITLSLDDNTHKNHSHGRMKLSIGVT
jgi:hypothetical protein